MDEFLKEIKDEFLMVLYELSKLKMVGYIVTFIQGEDAFLLRLYLYKELNAKQLSKELGITKGRITALINSLKRKNYIITRKNEHDKRSTLISLSEKGKIYLEEKLEKSDKYFENVFEVLGVNEASNLLNTIKNLLAKVRDVADEKNG